MVARDTAMWTAPVQRTPNALLQAGDLLVFNDTQVVPARLFGEKPSGGQLELLVERVLQTDVVNQVVAHLRVSKKPLVGTVLQMFNQAGTAPAFEATLAGPLAA